MPLIETATTYLLDLLVKNEEVKKFPQDFVSASMQWVRSWFLADDPVTEKVINSDKPAAVKEAVVEAKLEELMKNPQFVEELKAKVYEYERHRKRQKNVVGESAHIEAAGNVRLGDQGAATDEGYDQKNVVQGKIKAGGDVSIGDVNYSSGGNFQVVNNYYQHAAPGTPPPAAALSGLKKELQTLVAQDRTGEAVAKLADLSGQRADFHNTALLLSARWEQLKREEMQGTLSHAEVSVERAKITAAVLSLIGELV